MLKNAEKMRDLQERALSINERYLGQEHIDVAINLQCLGKAYGFLGDGVKHQQLLEHALVITERVYGANHREVGKIVENFAKVWRLASEEQKSRDGYKRARKILSRTESP